MWRLPVTGRSAVDDHGSHGMRTVNVAPCPAPSLAACTGAPMMMVDHVFHEYLTPEKVDKVLDELK